MAKFWHSLVIPNVSSLSYRKYRHWRICVSSSITSKPIDAITRHAELDATSIV